MLRLLETDPAKQVALELSLSNAGVYHSDKSRQLKPRPFPSHTVGSTAGMGRNVRSTSDIDLVKECAVCDSSHSRLTLCYGLHSFHRPSDPPFRVVYRFCLRV